MLGSLALRIRQRLARGFDHPVARRLRKVEADRVRFRAKTKAEQERLKRMCVALHRRVLSPDVLHDVLPLRARTLAARRQLVDADHEDARMQAIDPEYRDALARAASSDPMLHRTEIQGLTWWVAAPPAVTGDALRRAIAKQRFPYRNISQTRDLAIGAVLLDIGANTGRMSIPRVVLGDVSRAYCAEPDPLNYAALVRNIADNGLRGLVLPSRVAIGSEGRTAQLRRAKYSGGHRLVADGEQGDVDVACLRLDDWVARLAIDPALVTFVKVDTQGGEVQVLRGAPGLLSLSHVAWQLEVAPAMLEQLGTPVRELYAVCERWFTHFIDLDKRARGARARRVRELAEALAYLDGGAQTDILLFTASPGGRMLTEMDVPPRRER